MVLTSLLPAATAVAVGGVVHRVLAVAAGRATLASVGSALAAVGVLLTADQVSATLLMPLRNWVATRVNGEVRRTVRQAVAVRPGIDHLEDQVVRDAATLPIDNAYLFNLGAGAEGQLWLMTRFVGAVTAALVVARYSLPAAGIALAALVWQRALLRHHYAKAIATAATSTTGEGRAALYWSEVAGAPLGAKELRVFGYKDWALQQFARFGEVPLQQVTKVVVDALPLHWKIFGLNTVGGLVPFLLLGWHAASGGIDAAALATALGGVVAVARVLGSMGWEAYSIEASVPQLEAVRRLERYHREETVSAGARQPVPDDSHDSHDSGTGPLSVPTITFENVSFSYPGTDHDVLQSLDLELVPGQSVAIVGENGAGKTTLLKLLSRFYTPTAGRILIDGNDLQELDPRWWRKHLAVISQDFVHFELTALDNIALADLDRADRRLHAEAAAAAAGGRELIESLPNGWDTVLSRSFTGGVELSGGQWQRIALARALYAARVGGTVLVLDEPTASLDVSAEVALFDQLIDHARGLTAIIVSHRFSTVRRAERIVVLADGHVVEDGDHRTLHAAGGTYATLYDLQASRFQDSAPATTGEST
jgi:ATP-binding cassette subfamily B protein